MKTARTVLGVLLMLAGAVWILQGVNILPGSFMSGQTQWVIYGVIAAVIGAGLIVLSRRRA